MKFLLAGFNESQDSSAALTRVAALQDNIVRAVGDNITIPRGFNRIGAIAAISVLAAQARLVAPSIDAGKFLRISPVSVGDEPASPTPYMRKWDNPIELTETEVVNAEIQDTTAGASQSKVLVWFVEGTPEQVSGEIFTVRCTGTTTLTAEAWTDVPLTFADNLLAGRYAIVGARFESAGAIAGRLINLEEGGYRPGAIGYDSAGDFEDPIFRNGGLGVWFEFEHDTPPTAQFLATSADTAETVYLDLIRVREGSA